MKTIVQKFGGTSVASPELRERVVGHVERALSEGYAVVVVVSAMGRAGDPYATDTLLGLAADGKSSQGEAISPRDADLIMSCGEIISSVLLVQLLKKRGIDAVPLTGGQAGLITDAEFGNSHILEVDTSRINSEFASGKVVVVAGFQGITRDGEITTLGRGGSDTTAVALGAALNAESVEIYTDVEGVMTADPRIVPDARILQRMTYREVVEMAHLGAKVIHPRAVEIAMAQRVPLRIRCTTSDLPGTLISDERVQHTVEIAGDKVVTGIAHIKGMTQLQVWPDTDFIAGSDQALKVFDALSEQRISLDLIQVSPERITFIVRSDLGKRAGETVRDLGLKVRVTEGYAKVSAVGAGMRGVPGVMARIMRALTGAGIAVYQTSDSHANISCLVEEKDCETAVRALHKEFNLGEEKN